MPHLSPSHLETVTHESLSKALSDLPGALPASEVFGLLFGVLAAPLPPKPSKYIPIVFNGQQPSTIKHSESILQQLLTLHNQILHQTDSSEMCQLRRRHRETATGLQHQIQDLQGEIDGFMRGIHLGGITELEFRENIPNAYERLSSAYLVLREIDGIIKSRKRRGFSVEDYETYSIAINSFGLTISQAFLETYQHQRLSRTRSKPRTEKKTSFGFTHEPSRNDPCPCGSGKKFKHCHGGVGKITVQ
jgi:hypothetical protein